jgi:hypothetical protein
MPNRKKLGIMANNEFNRKLILYPNKKNLES